MSDEDDIDLKGRLDLTQVEATPSDRIYYDNASDTYLVFMIQPGSNLSGEPDRGFYRCFETVTEAGAYLQGVDDTTGDHTAGTLPRSVDKENWFEGDKEPVSDGAPSPRVVCLNCCATCDPDDACNDCEFCNDCGCCCGILDG